MTSSPWVSILVVWLVTLVVGGVLWQRFTRVPAQVGGLGTRTATSTRRVLPLWLVVLLLILFGVAVWLTVHWGSALWSAGRETGVTAL